RTAELNMSLDIVANRRAKKYDGCELTARLLWQLARPLFRYSPRPFFGWRNWLLRCFGARTGRKARIESSVLIQYPWMLEVGDFAAIGERVIIYNLGKVTIGARATISQQAHLCAGTHDYTHPDMPLERLPITIG